MDQPKHPAYPQTAADWMRALLGIDIGLCPCSGGVLFCDQVPPTSPFEPDSGARPRPRGRQERLRCRRPPRGSTLF